MKFFLTLIAVFSSYLLADSSALASDWNCKALKDSDILSRGNPKFRNYKKEQQGASPKAVTETATLVDGTILHFDHNGCKTLGDGTEKPAYEVRISLQESSVLPKNSLDKKWLEIATRVLHDAGLCEDSSNATKPWCQKLEQHKSDAKITKDAADLFVWRTSLDTSKLGEEETLVFYIIAKTPRLLRISNVVITEADNAD